ncbi:MAG: phenylacetate--CoA ligase [Synergistales bacterium]|nr:phenylacetate--CoA ligase [Synergistales bacterium]
MVGKAETGDRRPMDRLRGTLQRIWEERTPYSETMKQAGVQPADIRNREDVALLPFMKKSDLRDHYPLGLIACPKEDLVRVHASSGTTGKPTVVAYTERDIATWTEIMAHRLRVAGVTPGDVFQVALGYGLFTGALGFHWGAEALGAMVVPSGGGFTERQIMLMEDLGTTVFTSTPSYALHLAERIRDMEGVGELSLRIGIFGAEAWSEGMRSRIEKDLGITALDSYGLSEVIGPGVGMECPEKQGCHISDEHFLIEVINPETEEVLPKGEMGELVITTLTKEALPVVRYRTGDITRILPGSCPCGSTEPRIDRIQGRSDDMLIIRGVNVFPSQVEVALSRVEELALQYCLEVTEKDYMKELAVHCETIEPLSEERTGQIARRALKAIHEVTGIRTSVNLLPPGSLERSAGKAKRIVQPV